MFIAWVKVAESALIGTPCLACLTNSGILYCQRDYLLQGLDNCFYQFVGHVIHCGFVEIPLIKVQIFNIIPIIWVLGVLIPIWWK